MDVDQLEKIAVANLVDICKGHFTLSRLDRQTRASVYDAISRQSIAVQQTINDLTIAAVEAGLGKYRKREHEGDGYQAFSKRRRLPVEDTSSFPSPSATTTHAQGVDYDKLSKITVKNLIGICKSHFPLTRLDRTSKADVFNAISRQSIAVQQAIIAEADNAIKEGFLKRGMEKDKEEGDEGSSMRARLSAEEGTDSTAVSDAARQTDLEMNLGRTSEGNGEKTSHVICRINQRCRNNNCRTACSQRFHEQPITGNAKKYYFEIYRRYRK